MTIEQLKTIKISADSDIVAARQAGRQVAAEFGFGPAEVVLIVTVISELARNILLYAQEGEVTLNRVHELNRVGMEIIATDNGPGIDDIPAAMTFGYSTSGNLGIGLPGVRRVMDEFDIESDPEKGSRVRVVRWLNQTQSTSNRE